ncbi:MAG: aminopeptidase P family protein [Bacteroidales bacterium]|jgi:Xaa-Pro aminopeptidase|nr:aminopeptidase P family protein [Bacteroidales bacterium]
MSTKHRLDELKRLMTENSIDAFIIPSTDPHMSEYIADRWKTREWFSGFNGSAGMLIVTTEESGLWTDSRYFLQAARQLRPSGIKLFKQGLTDTPEPITWLTEKLPKNGVIAIDSEVCDTAFVEGVLAKCGKKGISLFDNAVIIDKVWEDRPEFPNKTVIDLDVKYSGLDRKKKIKDIREKVNANGAEAILMCGLDDIAWTFNLRGSDIEYNPLFLSFAYISKKSVLLFVDKSRISDDIIAKLEKEGVTILPYEDVYTFIETVEEKSVLTDKCRMNYKLFNALPETVKIVDNKSLPSLAKAIKNDIEIEGMRNAHIKDGVALVRFLIWLENTLEEGTTTEIEVADQLLHFRGLQKEFIGASFSTIAGYKANGAIVHYSANPKTNAEISKEGFLLIDSGGQYLDGTTDITRTVHLSTPDRKESRDYTLVLKGHINLANTKFMYGTRGTQLDVLARQPLWNHYMNYGHGTGHGIGCFMNVHEGPQSIRPNENPQIIEPGMITSNEPGIYVEGEYGIRIENLILAKEAKENGFGKFMEFDTITLCPIDLKPVVKQMLSPDELNWINDYHKNVYDKLSPFLDDDEKRWLKDKTQTV